MLNIIHSHIRYFTKYYFSFFFSILLSICLCRGNPVYPVKGKVKNLFTKTPLAFAKIVSEPSQDTYFTDINGNFSIKSDKPVSKLRISHPYFNKKVVNIDTNDTASHHIGLTRKQLFFTEKKTSNAAKTLMQKVLSQKRVNAPYNKNGIQYSTYNKLVSTPDNFKKLTPFLELYLKNFIPEVLHFDKKHHLIIMESATEKRYLNETNHDECIKKSKVSGINKSGVFTISSFIQPLSLYKNYVSIAGTDYISPLAGNPFKRYRFQIADTAISKNDTIYTLAFKPKKQKKTNKLKGFMYIHTGSYGIKYLKVRPAITSRFNLRFKQENIYINNRYWFPLICQTQANLRKIGFNLINIQSNATTWFYNHDTEQHFHKKDFDEFVLQYSDNQDSLNKKWPDIREQTFTSIDTNTYALYDSIDQQKSIEKILELGKGLYKREIPLGFIDIDLNKFLKVNRYENLRLGTGGHTNHKLSQKFSIGAYIGYGFRDQQVKYGLNTHIFLDKTKSNKLIFNYKNDLSEAGAVSFFKDRKQYNRENQRNLLLLKMDRLKSYEGILQYKPHKYLYTFAGINLFSKNPAYDYSFKGYNNSPFRFATLKAAISYAYGEQFIKTANDKISLQANYPVFWFQYTQAVNNQYYGDFHYQKIDLKTQYKFKVPGMGRIGIKWIGGIASGNIPYPNLYNGRGSFSSFSLVVQNSFETMHYKEFFNNRYTALFYNHHLGSISTPYNFFKPGFNIMHNMGIGTMHNKQQHEQVQFKTMKHGYYESGIFIEDIFIANKLTVGAGGFLRYGPYAFPKFQNNIVFKAGVDLKLF